MSVLTIGIQYLILTGQFTFLSVFKIVEIFLHMTNVETFLKAYCAIV